MTILPFERSYWVIPGRLIAGGTPTDIDNEKNIEKLNGLLKQNVNAVINLMESDETDHFGNEFYDYSHFLKQSNVDTYRLPIVDLSIPSIQKMKEILDLMDELIEKGKNVYVHCWGGVGRTGTVIGCYLKRHGLATNENVLDFIEYLKRTTSIADRESPETIEQADFVLEWDRNQ